MEKPVLAIFDKKIGMFDQPLVVRHLGEGLRDWDHVTKDKNTKYGRNPEDFDLYQIATFNEITGSFSPIQPHLHLQNGVQ